MYPLLPRLTYTEGCDGGEPRMVLLGYLTNMALLGLFARFYARTYHKVKRG